MTAHFLQTGSCNPAVPHLKSQVRDWVVVGNPTTLNHHSDSTTGMSQTKLLFNEAIPASARNRATHVHPPAPIVIERLLLLSEEQGDVNSAQSSISFTALSEERLHAAVQLAKRDLRRRRLESLTKSPTRVSQEGPLPEISGVERLQELAPAPRQTKSTASSLQNKAGKPGAKQSVLTSQKKPLSPITRICKLTQTRNPGPIQLEEDKQGSLSKEIHKLQHELEIYIQKVEELPNRGQKTEEQVEPEEQNKLEIRRQKQAAHSAQIIYVLQQQVKQIQEDIENFRIQKIWDIKKSVAINRLAAVHRSTVRALRVIIHQLSDLSHDKVPAYWKELGKLIRQLSLCSAKVEVENGSAVPESALCILQKLETLDSALGEKETLKKLQAPACPPHRKSPQWSSSPTRAPTGPSMSPGRGPRKPACSKRGRKKNALKPNTTSHQPSKRGEVLRAVLERFTQQREQSQPQRRPQTNTSCRKGRARHSEGSGAGSKMKCNQKQDAGFQQPTVSSQLRVNQLPQKEQSVPWIPTSPHSPPLQRSPQRRIPEPRCFFSPIKPSTSPPKQKSAVGLATKQPALSLEKRKDAHNEALREAWLDKMTMRRLQELNKLSKEEAERIQILRSQVGSPTQWAERAEQKARELIQPLLEEAQICQPRNRIPSSLKNRLSDQDAERATESAEQLSGALLEDLLEDTAKAALAVDADGQLEVMAEQRLQVPTLESMLLRMEEIQRDQEEVRRRFASITYSDPLHWAPPGAEGPLCHAPGSRPASPHPIRLTRPVLRPTYAGDIILKIPVETEHSIVSENSVSEEASQDQQQPRRSLMFPGSVEQTRGTVISVPSSTLRNIRRYREKHEAYLCAVAHETVGSFNPWAVADSIAEELLSEALADVAAEFQDVVEEYAEAVFTSEFLQPIQSPPASTLALVSH